ncbi:hypothetical protein TSOC_002067 [Tetrabaena socialis]|uniref:MYND-type domain-containing protein n=1 Tax=Tetrabaena socialis TaxID=47790 RepID=A0A2J8AF43_9CHLO|nr:hypothetical protein TSOC_002067 [Tetrabaena socialis]|eukprot:PNH11137.1 hypothetical protein TSOC_002067 [Tetrabaena socialis]
MGKPSKNGPISWEPHLAAARKASTLTQRKELAAPLVERLHAIFEAHAAASHDPHNSLCAAVADLDPKDPLSYRALRAVNDVLVASELSPLGALLVEGGLPASLVRLHERTADMAHPLSRCVLLVLTTTALMADAAAGNLEALAAQKEAVTLPLSHITFLAAHPAELLRSRAALGTALRCVQLAWEVTRSASLHCGAFRELLRAVDAPGRLLQLAATALAAGEGGGEPDGAAAAVAAIAALEDGAAGAGAGAGAAPAAAASATDAPGWGERMMLAAMAVSLAANLGGLGVRGFELSASGLAPLRAWLLRPGSLAALRAPLDGMADGIAELRRRLEREGAGGEGEEEEEEEEDGEDDDLHAGTIPLRASRDSTTAPFAAPYPGDFGPFFRAYAGHVEMAAPAIGVQLEDWGVRFTGEQASKDLPAMQVQEGVDARIAQAWLSGQVQNIVNWGHAMIALVRLGDQAKMPPPAPKQPQQQQQQLQQKRVAAPRPMRQQLKAESAEAGGGGGERAVAEAGATCGACGAIPPLGVPPFKLCGKCGGARYCSRACQVADWPSHKAACKQGEAVAAAAAAAEAAAAGAGAAGAAEEASPADAMDASPAAAEAAEAATVGAAGGGAVEAPAGDAAGADAGVEGDGSGEVEAGPSVSVI